MSSAVTGVIRVPNAEAAVAKILLVDDLPANLFALGELLLQDGVELFHSLSGRDALELLLIHDFALAIIDVQMPGMNGFELATLMRGIERTRAIPIIFITAGAHNQECRFQGYEAGAVDFLFKPIEPDVLRFKTSVFLELYRNRVELARQRDELRRSEQILSAELMAARKVQELSTRLIQDDETELLYREVLDTSLSLAGADFALLHCVESGENSGNVLRVLAHCGLSAGAAAHWNRVEPGRDLPFSVALREQRRIVVSAVTECDFMADTADFDDVENFGIRAMLSLPLQSRGGLSLGVLSTAWRRDYSPTEGELRSLDVVARQAADLIERSNAVQVIREAADRMQFMAESMPQKIFAADPQGSATYFNQQWTRFTGLPTDQLTGTQWLQTVHPDDGAETRRLWQQSVASGVDFEIDHRLRARDGRFRWHLSRARAMLDSKGAIKLWIGSNTDIHSQKEVEQSLRRSNEDLSQFAFAASHDLQEPLRMITTFSELLLEEYREKLDDKASIYTSKITDGTRRMRDLLYDLLSYTQLSPDRTHPEPSTDLNHAMALACENLRPVLQDANAELIVGSLPSVTGTESHFVQVFQNLIGNAVKYRGEHTPRIAVTVERKDMEWQFAVADNGIGIEPEYQLEIFRVFKRLHGRAIPGTGIGLSICQRVVERYGGRIWVESNAGAGVTFYFTMPVEELRP